jgi:mannitol-1-phosphate/altronate dehydrogenase
MSESADCPYCGIMTTRSCCAVPLVVELSSTCPALVHSLSLMRTDVNQFSIMKLLTMINQVHTELKHLGLLSDQPHKVVGAVKHA